MAKSDSAKTEEQRYNEIEQHLSGTNLFNNLLPGEIGECTIRRESPKNSGRGQQPEVMARPVSKQGDQEAEEERPNGVDEEQGRDEAQSPMAHQR